MGLVMTGASMSLDGYMSGPGETGFEHLFAWLGGRDVEVKTADPNMTLRMTDASAAHYRGMLEQTGAIIVGRKLLHSGLGWAPPDRLPGCCADPRAAIGLARTKTSTS